MNLKTTIDLVGQGLIQSEAFSSSQKLAFILTSIGMLGLLFLLKRKKRLKSRFKKELPKSCGFIALSILLWLLLLPTSLIFMFFNLTVGLILLGAFLLIGLITYLALLFV